MQRWEPPRATSTTPKPTRTAARARLSVPELWMMVAARMAIALFLLMPAVSLDIRGRLSYVIVAVLAGLLAIGFQANQWQMTNLRGQVAADLATFVFVVPPLVFGGFVAAETRNLLPAEQSALFQAGIGVLISFSILVAVSAWLSDGRRATIATLALPGFLLIPALSFVLHDYRNQTVITMIVVVYFIAAVSPLLTSLISDVLQPYVPAVLYGATVFAGIALVSPGTGNLGERDGLITASGWLLLLTGQAVLVVIPAMVSGVLPMIQWGAESAARTRKPTREGNDDGEWANS